MIEHQAHERLCAGNIRRRHDEIERRRPLARNEIVDAPVATARHLRDDRVTVKAEKRHGRRQHAGALVFGFVQKLARRRGDDGMRPLGAEMFRRHHRAKRRLDGAFGIGEEIGDARERLVKLSVEDMQDRADEKRVAGLFPMIAPLQRALGIDENAGDILHVAHFGGTATGASERTVKHWFAGTHGPSGQNLIALARHSDAVLMYILVAANRPSSAIGIQLISICAKLQELVETIDAYKDG